MQSNVHIVDAVRTPMGRAHKGRLAQVRPDDMAACVVRALLERHPSLGADQIDDVVGATAFPEAEQGFNLGRVVAQRAGLPDHVPGMVLNRWCASGLEAIATAHAKIAMGMADAVIAFGVESMSMIPMGGHRFTPNPWLAQHHPEMFLGMGLTAENLVQRHEISREDQDRFALQSHQRALAAEESGHWQTERIPYSLEAISGLPGDELARDEGPRADTSLEALAQLTPHAGVFHSLRHGLIILPVFRRYILPTIEPFFIISLDSHYIQKHVPRIACHSYFGSWRISPGHSNFFNSQTELPGKKNQFHIKTKPIDAHQLYNRFQPFSCKQFKTALRVFKGEPRNDPYAAVKHFTHDSPDE